MADSALPQHIRFGRETCGRIEEAERREWWLGNGLGGYAAGTVAGTLTRRYHGLLVAPVNPPLGRILVFTKADAMLRDAGRTYALCANRWADGTLDPRGYIEIESFRLDGCMPVWRFAFGEMVIEQRIWLEHGANTTYVAYRLQPGGGATRTAPVLSITLLVNARDHHATTQPWRVRPAIEAGGARLRVRHGDWFTLHLAANGDIEPRRTWYENFDLPAEAERGLENRDHHLCVGVADVSLVEGEWVGIAASVDGPPSLALGEVLGRSLARERSELARVKSTVHELADAPGWIDQLTLAADLFVIARPLEDLPDGESIIAGYPWFGDWGRDTMIALPGLALATGRLATAARILRTFARFVDQGMLPNTFPGSGETPEYNSVDAALWYVEAWRAYVDASGDLAAVRDTFPVLHAIIDWYVRGTRYGIGMDGSDGLLRAGAPGLQITWMDAKIGDRVVTPRIGKPVEINALWFNALCVMAQLADRLGMPSQGYRSLAERARLGFARFLDLDRGGLLDVVDGPDGEDSTLRPNQIFAVSLPFSPLSFGTQRSVVEVVAHELLTSYGLRSLSPAHPAYRGTYRGGVSERDGSYHQGPVWPWLLGPYAVAHHRVHGDAAAAQRLLEPLSDHLRDAGLGTIGEIFDGSAPHLPRGCPSQAWSVACVLEAWQRLEKCKRTTAQRSTGGGARLPLTLAAS